MKRIPVIFFVLLSSLGYSQTWSDLDSGVYYNSLYGDVQCLSVYNGELYATGGFNKAGDIPAYLIARWNGVQWDSVPGMTPGTINSFCAANGVLYIGGNFNLGFPGARELAEWNGSNWSAVSSQTPNNTVYSIAYYNNNLYIGGNFTGVGSVTSNRIAKFNGTNWSGMSGGVTVGFIPQVRSMAVFHNELYVAGDFTYAGGIACNNIAKWNGTSWDSVGSNGVNANVITMLADTVHDVLWVTGQFTNAGGVPISNNIAIWNGSNWSSIPQIMFSGNILALYRNELFLGATSATGQMTDTILSKWDGISWQRIQGPNNTVSSLQVFNDKLIVGGYFDQVYDSSQGWLTVNGIASYWEPDNTSVSEVKTGSVSVYPNPCYSKLTVQVSSNTILNNLTLYTTDGRLVKSIVNCPLSTVNLDLQGLSAGIYVLDCEGENGHERVKVVKTE